MKTINKIASVRKSKGLSQEELGNRIGVTKTSVFRYEKDDNKLTLPLLMQISGALQCKFWDLLNVAPPSANIDDEAIEKAIVLIERAEKIENVIISTGAKAKVVTILVKYYLENSKMPAEEEIKHYLRLVA